MITLMQFQQTAASGLADRFLTYAEDPVVTGTARKPHRVPFFQALSAITASGKTVVLAEATAEIAEALPVKPVVLWLSKGKVVVEQSYANLLAGGKYAHILGDAVVRGLSDYDANEVSDAKVPLLFFATVGTFNQKDKEKGDRLIYQCDIDNADRSVWDALKVRTDTNGVRRPLLVVYDEGHNLSDQQTNLLMELQPDAFLLASATMRLPGRLAKEVKHVRDAKGEEFLITEMPASQVAASGLVKDSVVLAGYKTPMEETIDSMLADMELTAEDAETYDLGGAPKAIYVCNTNMVASDAFRRDDPKRPFTQREAAPILIWRHLTEHHGIDPSTIAIYATLAFDRHFPPPPELILFNQGDSDYARFTEGDYKHIIFNLTLQEGWDDPYVYFAYVDKSMESSVQIEQVIGRLLRQPRAVRQPVERLNTASFYVRVDRNEVFNDVLASVSARLSKEAPGVRLTAIAPDKPGWVIEPVKTRLEVPATGYNAKAAAAPIANLLATLPDYRTDTVNTRGKGERRIVLQRVGEDSTGPDTHWEEFEQSNLVSARWVFSREVKRRFAYALQVVETSNEKLNAMVALGSPAAVHIAKVAGEVVEQYVANVALTQKPVDPYVVQESKLRQGDRIPFNNAGHAGYDRLNGDELEFANAIDDTGRTWVRNPSQSGYGIPLISLGTTRTFYPDFLIWDGIRVIALDTKGAHLLREAAGRKLLSITPPIGATAELVIRFISKGKYNDKMELHDKGGYTLWSRREDGNLRANTQDSMRDAVAALLV